MNISRRGFLQTGIGALGLGVLPSPIREMSDELRIGIVGVGRQGLRLLRELLTLKHVTIGGLCDTNAEALRTAAQWVVPPTRTTPNALDLVHWPEIDGVIVATPDPTHAEIALAALAAGKDVYLETPMARTVSQGAALVAAADQSRRIVQVSSPLLNHPRILAAMETLQRGAVGQIVQVTVAVQTPHTLNPDHWTASPVAATPARLFAPYLDVVHWLLDLGLPAYVVAHGRNVIKPAAPLTATPDLFYGVIDYPEGVMVHLSAGVAEPAFALHGTHGTIDLRGLTPQEGTSGLADWLTCLRSRIAPPAGVGRGQQHTQILEWLEVAYTSGKRQGSS